MNKIFITRKWFHPIYGRRRRPRGAYDVPINPEFVSLRAIRLRLSIHSHRSQLDTRKLRAKHEHFFHEWIEFSCFWFWSPYTVASSRRIGWRYLLWHCVARQIPIPLRWYRILRGECWKWNQCYLSADLQIVKALSKRQWARLVLIHTQPTQHKIRFMCSWIARFRFFSSSFLYAALSQTHGSRLNNVRCERYSHKSHTSSVCRVAATYRVL